MSSSSLLRTSSSLERVLKSRLNPPPPASSWERETGRGMQQFSFGEYRLCVSVDEHRQEEIIVEEKCSISTRVWDCAVFTIKWMERLISSERNGSLSKVLKLSKDADAPQVLELGAGTGLLSIYLAKLGAAVMSTEYGHAVSHLAGNCGKNAVLQNPASDHDRVMIPGKVYCRELDWYKTDETLDRLFHGSDSRPIFDLIVVTDCSLSERESAFVMQVIRKYATPGHTKVLVGLCKERAGTATFLETTRECFSNMIVIKDSDHHPDYRSKRQTVCIFET